MSAPVSDPYAAIVDFYASHFIGGCCGTAILFLVLYEHAITFDDEFELFWKGKASSASVMFFLNRYLTLLGYLTSLPGTYHSIQSDIGCRLTIVVFQGADLLRYFPQAAFSSLRVYALSDRKIWLAALVFLLLMGPVGVNLSTIRSLHISRSPPPVGCVSFNSVPPQLANQLTIISRSCAIAADLLVVMVTWWKTRKSIKLYRQANLKTTYGSLILRDGTMYFLTLSTLNVLHMALTLLAYTQEYIAVSYIPAFNSPITSILVSRFLLNLRQVDRVSANPMGSEQPSFVDPQAREPFAEFASFVAPLHDIAEDDLSLRWNVSASAGSSAGAGSASGVEPADSGESHGEDEGADPLDDHDVVEGNPASPLTTSQDLDDAYHV